MDKEYIAKQKLDRIQRHFSRMVNEGYLSTSLEEAEDDDDNQNGGGMPSMDNNQQGEMPGGGMNQLNGDMPTADGNQPNVGGGNDIPDMMGQDSQQQMPDDGNQGNIDADMPDFGEDDDLESEEDDDVIDLDDLTDAQEKLNNKQNNLGKDLGQLDGRIEKLLSAVETMKKTIDNNNADITALKAELQKRVPTNTERLNMRSLDSYPFNINPTDYWKKKEAEGIYSTGLDDIEKAKEYTITNDDVNNYNESEVANSLDPNLRQTMKDIFNGF
jgi:hypothetical protein